MSARWSGISHFSQDSSGGGRPPDDDDYGFSDEPPPSRQRPQAGDTGGQRRTVQFQPEERYWTEYLRIALPIIGLVLMIGIFWWWASLLLDDNDDPTEPVDNGTIGEVLEEDDEEATPPPATEPPATPPPPPEEEEDPTEPPPEENDEADPVDEGGDTQVNDEEDPADENGNDNGNDEEEQPANDEIGVDSQVVTTEDAVNFRSEPSTEGEILQELPADLDLTINDGPIDADGWTWWGAVTPNGNTGWLVEEFIELAEE